MNDYQVYYGLTLLAFVITFGAQLYINAAYSKYSRIANHAGISGARTASEILYRNDLGQIGVNPTGGYLTDHYDPQKKSVTLSQNNYSDNSIAAMAVAAHECGHALQDKENYAFLRIRAALVPAVNFSSYAGYLAITIGLLFSSYSIIWIGILLECVILVFQLVTLPVEFNASRRALVQLNDLGLAQGDDLKGAKTVLTAAALTYVAGVASALIQVFRLVLLYGGRGNRDDR